MANPSEALDRDWSDAVAALRDLRRRVVEEITSYPTPIAGCDAQFNHLLAQRRKIVAALAALEAKPFIPTPREPFPRIATHA